MALVTTWCRVMHSEVTIVTNLEDEVANVFCHEFDPTTKECRLKSTAGGGGPLSQLLEHVSDGTLGRRSVRCHLV